MSIKYRLRRKSIERVFTPNNLIADSRNVIISPSGNFELETTIYSTGATSAFSRGVVKRLSENRIVADVKRNHRMFWHAWVNHLNGYEYLLCGEDYQGYTIINLTTEKQQVFFAPKGHEGFGFCWTAAYPSPDGKVLAVDGCYWACPYEIVFFDFSDPTQLPLPELDRWENITDPVIGWTDNQTFVFSVDQIVRKSDGLSYQELSDDEQVILDNNPTLRDEVTKQIEWKRSKS